VALRFVPSGKFETLAKEAPTQDLLFGTGCFWCGQAAFSLVPGVISTECGYGGGTIQHPTYEQVSAHKTGHIELTRVTYNPARVSLRRLLDIFVMIHDPTRADGQGADIGPQYRSAVFCSNKWQLERARDYVATVPNAVTIVEMSHDYYQAEAYHQDYFQKHQDQAYCQVVIAPKTAKLQSHLGQ
jgi:peptide-methionine (S)-S-oxide reductase